MPLHLPPYLRALAASTPPVSHTWEQGDSMVALGNDNPTMLKNLGGLSLRSLLGLKAALGEWMHQRFVHLYDDEEHRLLNEALWAASIDYRYLEIEAMTFTRDESSPIQGPLQLSKSGAKKICHCYSVAEFGIVRYLNAHANLVKYVLPDSKAFQAWFKAVVVRLQELSEPSARIAGAFDIKRKKTEPRGVPADIFGTPVPREAFDPTFDIANADMATLIDAMLVAIASAPNPFLRSPEEVKAMGFEGTPYRYSA